MKRDVLTIGHPVLRERARSVDRDELASAEFQGLIDDLVETMRAASGAGLAAIQIGVPVRLVAVEVSNNPRYPYKPAIPLTILVNPEVTPLDRSTIVVNEGCLSVPGLRGDVRRYRSVEVTWTDRFGMPQSTEAHGLTAGTFQHECDHLDGILFVDRLTDSRSLTSWDNFKEFHEGAFLERVANLTG